MVGRARRRAKQTRPTPTALGMKAASEERNTTMTRASRRMISLTSGLVLTAALLASCGGKSEADLTASGKQLLAEKNTSAAIIQLKSALQKAPDSVEARLLLGKALLESGDPVSALVELRKAQELRSPDEDVVPSIAQAMLLTGEHARMIEQFGSLRLKDNKAAADLFTSLATAHVINDDKDKARALIAQAQQSVAGHFQSTILNARLQASEGDFDGALALLEQALIKQPGDESAGVLKGEIQRHGKRDTAAALESFKKVLETNPKSVGAHTSIVTILTEQQKPAEAKAQFDLLKKAAPNHPETLFYEAQFAFAAKDYKTTRDITDRLLKAMPDNVRVLELAGGAEYRLQQYPQAEAFLGRALKIVPGLLLSRQLLAQTYLRTNQPNKAVDVLAPIVESKNPDGTSLALAGEAWAQLGDTKKADAAFAMASKIAPNDTRVRTSAALAQLSRGNSGAAIGQLEAIAAEDKGPRADVALISARLRQNDIEGALKAIDGLQSKTPDRPVAYNLRGRVLLLKRDLPGATKAFELALSKDPAYFPAVASLAALELNAGKPELARKRFEDLTQAKPKSHEAWLALSELAVRTGAAPDQVVKYLRDGVKANPGSAAPHVALINHLLSSNDGKSALTAAREATGALPNNLEVMDALGRAQLAGDTAEQAISTFKQLTALQTTNPMHHIRLAEAQAANKDPVGARQSLRKALEIKPDMLMAKRALVSLALMEKRPQEALDVAKDMQKQAPKDATGFALEGDIEVVRKNFDLANTAYKTAFALSKTTDVVVRLHTGLRLAGKSTEADKLAGDWIKDRPKDAGFRFYLGDIAMSQDKLADAEGHYRSVLETQPRNALAMNNVAWLLVKQGKPGAVAMAQQANELMPGRPPLMDTLATALAADNKLPLAIETQKAAISRNPADPSLKLNLAKLLIKSGEKAYARAELEDLVKLGDKFRGQAEVAALLKTL